LQKQSNEPSGFVVVVLAPPLVDVVVIVKLVGVLVVTVDVATETEVVVVPSPALPSSSLQPEITAHTIVESTEATKPMLRARGVRIGEP
jgi:hypothetical protein